MADISQIVVGNTTYNVKDTTARGSILEPLIGTTANVTPTQVATAVAEGRTVAITHTIPLFGDATFANFGVSANMGVVVSTTMLYQSNRLNAFQLIGTLSSNAWSIQIGVTGVPMQPSGNVSAPTITCTPTTASVNSITGVGTLPTLTDDVTNETLSFSWAQGTLPTQGTAQTVMTGVSATASTPYFTGDADVYFVKLLYD